MCANQTKKTARLAADPAVNAIIFSALCQLIIEVEGYGRQKCGNWSLERQLAFRATLSEINEWHNELAINLIQHRVPVIIYVINRGLPPDALNSLSSEVQLDQAKFMHQAMMHLCREFNRARTECEARLAPQTKARRLIRSLCRSYSGRYRELKYAALLASAPHLYVPNC